ncbi:hypothetical protein T484DRAFT_1915244, partial [Baffinella frigidus]
MTSRPHGNMVPKIALLLALAAVPLVHGYPAKLGSCTRDITPSGTIMGQSVVPSAALTVQLSGQACGGTIDAGTAYSLTLGGQETNFVVDLSGTATGTFATKQTLETGTVCDQRTMSSSDTVTFTAAGTAIFRMITATGPSAALSTTQNTCDYTVTSTIAVPGVNITSLKQVIERVLFSKELHILHITFDRLTNRNEVPGVAPAENSCSNNLDPSFLSTLGTDPHCSWTDRRTLEIVLGAGATVDMATRVLLSPLSSITFASDVDGITITSLPATTVVGVLVDGIATGDFFPSFSGALPVPKQIITGTRNLSACQLVNADASLSEGHGGKPFTEIGWTLDFTTSFAEAGILAPKHDAVFLNRYISFSTVLSSEVSNTTLKLRPNTPVLPRSLITISGLPSEGFAPKYYGCPHETETPPVPVQCRHNTALFDCINVKLEGPGAVLFTTGDVSYGTLQAGVHVGQWQPLEGDEAIFVMQVDSESHLPSDADTVLWFEMLNPRFQTTRRTPAISVLCYRCSCVGQLSCTLGENIFDMDFPKQPLLVGMDCVGCATDVAFGVDDFDITALSSSISETTTVNSAVNNLTLSFVTDVDMPPGSSVILDDFHPVPGGWDGAICLTGRDSDVFECQAC